VGQSVRPRRVFISYAHESEEHGEQVRNLWLFLRRHGVDARLDRPAAEQRQDWASWMAAEVREADHVLVVASTAYRERAEGRSGPDSGRGVQWETRLIQNAFYADQRALDRFVPVVLPGESVAGVPDFLTPATSTVYQVHEFTLSGAEKLLRLLLGQPEEVEPALGRAPVLGQRNHLLTSRADEDDLPKAGDRSQRPAAVDRDQTGSVLSRRFSRIRSVWNERRENNIRRRLLTSVLPSLYDHLSPEWLSDRSVASLPVPSSYLQLRSTEDMSKSALANAGTLETCELTQGYQRSGQALLVLGKAGAGKTRALLHLLQDLTTKASGSRDEPIPFYLHLSAWDGGRGTFEAWCIREIAERYALSHEYVQKWLLEIDVALVLDGLDELPLRRRSSCISAINRFTQDHGQIPLVVASRTDEYLSARGQLRLRGCQEIRPLSTHTVLAILERVDGGQAGLHEKARDDSSLRQLLRTPLFLQLGLLAYQNVPAEDIVQRENSWQSSIIGSYFDQAEKRIAHRRPDADIGLTTWLPRLAVRLRTGHQNTFYVDRLPLFLLDESGRRAVARHTAIAAVLITLAVLIVVRVPLLIAGSHNEYFTPYASTAIIGSFFSCLLSWKVGQKALDAPPASRRTQFMNRLKRAALQWWSGYMIIGLLAWTAPKSNMWATVVMLGSIGVAVAPSVTIVRSTESRAPDELPEYPGHETKTLLMCSLASVGMIVLAIGATLWLALGPMNSRQQLTFLPTLAMLPYFVVLFAVPAGLLNGGAELLSRFIARRRLARFGLLPKKFMMSFHNLQRSSILVQSLGGYEFIHLLIRDELVRRSAASHLLRQT
jgi:hypothetical protein